jgi:hypothetical protein
MAIAASDASKISSNQLGTPTEKYLICRSVWTCRTGYQKYLGNRKGGYRDGAVLFFVLLISCFAEATAMRPKLIQDLAEHHGVMCSKKVRILDFCDGDDNRFTLFDILYLEGIRHEALSPPIGESLSIEHGQCFARRLRQCSSHHPSRCSAYLGAVEKLCRIPYFDSPSGRVSEVLDNSLPSDPLSCLKWKYFNPLRSDPSSLAGPKILITKIVSFSSGLELKTVNNGGTDSNDHSSYFKSRFPPWRLLWMACASFLLAQWGCWELRNNRRVVSGFLGFTIGCSLWGYIFSAMLSWWLAL